MNSHSLALDLDNHSVKPTKAQAQSPKEGGASHLFLAENKPSNLMTKILSIFDSFYEKKLKGLEAGLNYTL
jgi:hypothetical protein